MSMDYYNGPQYNSYGLPLNPYGAPTNFSVGQQMFQQSQQEQQNMIAQQQAFQAKMAELETPTIVATGRSLFNIESDDSKNKRTSIIPVDNDISDVEVSNKKRGPGRPRKESGNTSIVRADDKAETLSPAIIEDAPTIYSYMETNGLLHETLAQIDAINGELVQEFNAVRRNRTMKNKYNTLIGISENISSMINNRLSAIKEINSTITKSNDVDYKKAKDSRAAAANIDDDKYIADLYKSFIQNPMTTPATPQMPQIDPAIFGSGIVRADIRSDMNAGGPVDASYLNYLSNLTPEQNMMRYEDNGNVKQVVVFDAATGNRFFQVMDVSTGQVIPNVPVYDQMFMEDTTLDLKTKVAKNINLNETFPIVVINEGVTAEY